MGSRPPDSYFNDLASEIEEHPAQIEDRLIELEWSRAFFVTATVEGKAVRFEVDAADFQHTWHGTPVSAKERACDECVLMGLRDSELATDAGGSFRRAAVPESNTDLAESVVEGLRALVKPMVQDAMDAAKARNAARLECHKAAEQALALVREENLEGSLSEAERGAALELEFDPGRPYYCIAFGGGRADEDETEKTVLSLRNKLRDALARVGSSKIVSDLESYRAAGTAKERASALKKFASPNIQETLLRIAVDRHLPRWLATTALHAVALQGHLGVRSLRRLMLVAQQIGSRADKAVVEGIVRCAVQLGVRDRLRCTRVLKDVLLLDLTEDLRVAVLKTLAQFADVGDVEQVLSFPAQSNAVHAAMRDLVDAISHRPTRISSLRPRDLESVACWVLRRENPDHALDVIRGSSRHRINHSEQPLQSTTNLNDARVIVMFKNTGPVSVEDVAALGAQGYLDRVWHRYLVTTRGCDAAAHAVAQEFRVDLVGPSDLVAMLEKHLPGAFVL